MDYSKRDNRICKYDKKSVDYNYQIYIKTKIPEIVFKWAEKNKFKITSEIDQGENGIAFETECNNVIKATTNPYEGFVALESIDNKLDNYVNVFDVDILDNDLIIISMEKVDTYRFEVEEPFDYLSFISNQFCDGCYLREISEEIFTPDDITKNLNDVLTGFPKECLDVLKSYSNNFKKTFGFYPTDLNDTNVGFNKNNSIVFFDTMIEKEKIHLIKYLKNKNSECTKQYNETVSSNKRFKHTKNQF